MSENLTEINLVTGHLTQLIQKYKELSREVEKQAGSNPDARYSLEQQKTFVTKMYEFISKNEYWLDQNDEFSITYLHDVDEIQADLQKYWRVLPQQTSRFALAVTTNPEILKIVKEQNDLFDRQHNNFRRTDNLEKRIDPNAKDPKKEERCLMLNAKSFESYPGRSIPLKTKIDHLKTEIKSQLDSMKEEAKSFDQQFVNSLSESSDNSNYEFYQSHPEHFTSVVQLKSQALAETDQNLWSKRLFSVERKESQPKKRLEILSKLHSLCNSHEIRKMSKEELLEKSVEKAAVMGTDIELPKNGELVLALNRTIGKAQYIFEVRNDGGRIHGAIYILNDPRTPISLSDVCVSLGGFCRYPDEQIRGAPEYYFELDMPKGGAMGRTLKVPATEVTRSSFIEHAKRLNIKFRP